LSAHGTTLAMVATRHLVSTLPGHGPPPDLAPPRPSRCCPADHAVLGGARGRSAHRPLRSQSGHACLGFHLCNRHARRQFHWADSVIRPPQERPASDKCSFAAICQPYARRIRTPCGAVVRDHSCAHFRQGLRIRSVSAPCRINPAPLGPWIISVLWSFPCRARKLGRPVG
jgi:hypothetical protein